MANLTSVQPLPGDIRNAYIQSICELAHIDRQINELRRCIDVLHKYASKRVVAPRHRRGSVPLYIAKDVTPTAPVLIPVQQITAHVSTNRRPLLAALEKNAANFGNHTPKRAPSKSAAKASKKRNKALVIAQV